LRQFVLYPSAQLLLRGAIWFVASALVVFLLHAGTVPAAAEGGARGNIVPLDLRPTTIREPGRVADSRESPVLFLPQGFSATVFAQLTVPNARALTVGPSGAVYLSVPRYGAVDAFVDENGDGFADSQHTLLSDRPCPYGLAVHDQWLYVAETRQVTRFPLAEDGRSLTGPGEVLVDGLPEQACRPHGYRPLALSPAEDALYLALGSTCNVCIEQGPSAAQQATVWRFPLGTAGEGSEVARGLRNVVDLEINPWTGALWGVNVERDNMDDDTPPEWITEIQTGADYGWPYCYYGPDGHWYVDLRVPATDSACEGLTLPSVLYQAHTSPLGLAFHDGTGLPAALGPSLFVAFHGSWDHSTGVGYKVVRLPIDAQGQPEGPPQEFALGWLMRPQEPTHSDAWGRPVDVAVGPDGALYVSDDKRGVVYRLAYTG
jgi:glucose/arabinose dehydrogenase